jgi:hypothetical protein
MHHREQQRECSEVSLLHENMWPGAAASFTCCRAGLGCSILLTIKKQYWVDSQSLTRQDNKERSDTVTLQPALVQTKSSHNSYSAL